MRILLITFFLLICSGCASMASQGAIIRAHNNFDKGNYNEAISITEHSMSSYSSTYTDEQKAELLFLKANSYVKLNDVKSALGVFKYLIDKYPETEHAYRAKNILANAAKEYSK